VQPLPLSLSVSRRRARPGFTLIELVTATSLMTVMMLGMVQIFAIITQTASDAQGLQFAQEQARGILDTIHRDIRGLTSEGYLKIVASPAVMTSSNYAGDSLALTTVGNFSGVWGGNPTAGAAEILYTLQVLDGDKTKIKTSPPPPGNLNRPTFWLGTAGTTNLIGSANPRRSILARGQWLTVLATSGSTGGNSGLDSDTDFSAAKSLPEFSTNPSPSLRRPERYYTTIGGVNVPYTTVWPLTSTMGSQDSSQNPSSLRRVAGSCTSEFFVEYLAWDGKSDYTWNHLPVDIKPGTHTKGPRAIRVTVAIHDPDDRKPLTAGVNRFQGYALQEVYWIRDP
jgi:type II secretory pathway pseudopilin PulG